MSRISGARKYADAVRDDLRSYVVKHLGEPPAVLVVDETGFPKKGTQSVGVQRQHSGTAGRRVENGQIGVFLAYPGSWGHVFLDRELYLPREWAEDAEPRKEAGVPEAKRGWVLPRRGGERGFAMMARFPRSARDDERMLETLVGLHFVALAIVRVAKAAPWFNRASHAWALTRSAKSAGDGLVRHRVH